MFPGPCIHFVVSRDVVDHGELFRCGCGEAFTAAQLTALICPPLTTAGAQQLIFVLLKME